MAADMDAELEGNLDDNFSDPGYGLPNDIAQQDRLLRHHDLIKTRLGSKLALAPLPPNPQRVIDLGTGVGLWAIEMGKILLSIIRVASFYWRLSVIWRCQNLSDLKTYSYHSMDLTAIFLALFWHNLSF